MFCETARKNGIDIWTLPFIELSHCGSYVQHGNMIQMAQQGVHATISGEYAESLQKPSEQSITKPTGKQFLTRTQNFDIICYYLIGIGL